MDAASSSWRLTGTLPADGHSTGAIAAADFDGDGQTDLFVGGRVVPGKYPATPRSFLYRNTGGKFVDVTEELAPGLREIGMVTAASFADLDGDNRPDLVLALEWGPSHTCTIPAKASATSPKSRA